MCVYIYTYLCIYIYILYTYMYIYIHTYFNFHGRQHRFLHLSSVFDQDVAPGLRETAVVLWKLQIETMLPH